MLQSSLTSENELLIKFVRLGLSDSCHQRDIENIYLSHEDYMYLSANELYAIEFDGYQKIHNTLGFETLSMDDLMDWFGLSRYQETVYAQHKETINKLAGFYANHGIKMLLLKGIGLSLNYSRPNHRPCGDIDIYLYGDGGMADALILSELGIESKQNEDKHSVFKFDGITVENHASIINDVRHPSHKVLEQYFEQDVENSIPVSMVAEDLVGFYLPSVSTNALYLPLHLAGHFVHGDASLRQLVDWACFVQKYHNHISWSNIEQWANKSGFFKFYCCLNGIVQDYLGVDSAFFPHWPRDKKLEDRILNEILNKRERKRKNLSLVHKVVKFFRSGWKFRLVYDENILVSSLRQARAYALVKWNMGSNNIWKRQRQYRKQ